MWVCPRISMAAALHGTGGQTIVYERSKTEFGAGLMGKPGKRLNGSPVAAK
jgi:hypothetical protein